MDQLQHRPKKLFSFKLYWNFCTKCNTNEQNLFLLKSCILNFKEKTHFKAGTEKNPQKISQIFRFLVAVLLRVLIQQLSMFQLMKRSSLCLSTWMYFKIFCLDNGKNVSNLMSQGNPKQVHCIVNVLWLG